MTPLAVPDEAVVSPKLTAPILVLRSSVLTPVMPPSMAPVREPALAIAKLSAPVPPTRLPMPLKFVVPLTSPLLAPVTL